MYLQEILKPSGHCSKDNKFAEISQLTTLTVTAASISEVSSL